MLVTAMTTQREGIMRRRGINYDTGFFPGGRLSRERFDPETVRQEMAVIAGELHCTAVRISGGDAERLAVAGRCAAGAWEDVDWTPFDIVGVDAYRDASNAEGFRGEVRRRGTFGKPVAVTEFGCCAYRGAADRGGAGWMIVDRDAEPLRIRGDQVRDESEQVTYLRELLEIFEQEGVDSAFWFTFAGYDLPHRPEDPEHDLDLASYGVVKFGEDGVSWEPKEVFHPLAAAYAR
jgi:hypothetical protein